MSSVSLPATAQFPPEPMALSGAGAQSNIQNGGVYMVGWTINSSVQVNTRFDVATAQECSALSTMTADQACSVPSWTQSPALSGQTTASGQIQGSGAVQLLSNYMGGTGGQSHLQPGDIGGHSLSRAGQADAQAANAEHGQRSGHGELGPPLIITFTVRGGMGGGMMGMEAPLNGLIAPDELSV